MSNVEASAGHPVGARPNLIQSILDMFDKPSYLEIGVNEGATFFALKAHRKVAVDPKFLFDYKTAALSDPSAQFYPITSDEYFSKNGELFDVIFLDGLHVFDQTLRDFLNASECLKFNGVIVIDDILPTSYHASIPDHSRSIKARQALKLTAKDWMGDVYRLVYFIESYCQQFAFRSVGSRGLAWKQRRPVKSLGNKSVRQISELAFDSVLLDPGCYNRRSLDAVISELKSR